MSVAVIGDVRVARALGAAVADGVPPDAALVLAPAALLDRAVAAGVAAIVLDAPACPVERAALLDRGAADVVAAGIDAIELAARVRAVLRRSPPAAIRCGDLRIDPVDRAASRGGRPLPLHPRAFAVLLHLARRQGRPVSRAALYEAVWHRRFDPGTNVVAVTMGRLRAVVDAGAPRLIHTVAGGYMLRAAVAGGVTAGQGAAP